MDSLLPDRRINFTRPRTHSSKPRRVGPGVVIVLVQWLACSRPFFLPTLYPTLCWVDSCALWLSFVGLFLRADLVNERVGALI